MDEGSRDALLSVAEDLRLRTGQIVTALDLLDEIAVRERVPPAAILSREELRRIIGGSGSGPARASAFLISLRSIRYPRLAAATEELRAEISALRLPRGVSLKLPKELGSDELTISIQAGNPAQLERAVAALTEKIGGLARIFDLLGGRG